MEETVLVVEDDLRLSEVVSSVLTLAGYRPITIADHRLIGGSVDRWRPRCVIMDGEVRSSGQSGTWDDAATMHREHPALPVMLFSADSAVLAEARAGQSRRSRAAGFAGFLSKPFVVDEFLATVKSALDGAAPIDAVVEVARPDEPAALDVVLLPALIEQVPATPDHADLFATVVHELRQPLTVIRGQLQLGLRHVGTDQARERVAIDLAIEQVDRMGRLLGEMSDPANVISNDLSLHVGVVDLVSVVVDAIGRHEDGDAKRISFHWPHGPVSVRGDPERIAQILDNLLGNALKYSAPDAPIEISMTVLGTEAQVRIADHGVGIPADERARLFTPFFRGSTSRDMPGTGLGLHISKRLAERQGGRLWLEASSSAGSVFALELAVAAVSRSDHRSATT